jgi:hypothetical protein
VENQPDPVQRCVDAFCRQDYARSAELAMPLVSTAPRHDLWQVLLISLQRLGDGPMLARVSPLALKATEAEPLQNNLIRLTLGLAHQAPPMEDEELCRFAYYRGARLLTMGDRRGAAEYLQRSLSWECTWLLEHRLALAEHRRAVAAPGGTPRAPEGRTGEPPSPASPSGAPALPPAAAGARLRPVHRALCALIAGAKERPLNPQLVAALAEAIGRAKDIPLAPEFPAAAAVLQRLAQSKTITAQQAKAASDEMEGILQVARLSMPPVPQLRVDTPAGALQAVVRRISDIMPSVAFIEFARARDGEYGAKVFAGTLEPGLHALAPLLDRMG